VGLHPAPCPNPWLYEDSIRSFEFGEVLSDGAPRRTFLNGSCFARRFIVTDPQASRSTWSREARVSP
jgi:hypothetical protein